MRTKEVIVSNPESKVVVGTVDVVKTICVTIRSLIGAVQPFNHLFEWSVFCRNSIVVGKSNNLSDFDDLKEATKPKILVKILIFIIIIAVILGTIFVLDRVLDLGILSRLGINF